MLAFDCACSGLSLAVLDGERVLAEHGELAATGQAALLAPAIRTLLDRAGFKPADLALLGTTNGPGSFTGIRIGLAMARGLALALGIPLAACSTFTAVMAGLDDAQRQRIAAASARTIAAIDSRREEIFIASVDHAGAMDTRIARPADAVGGLPSGAYALVGDGAALLQAAFAAAGRTGEIVLIDPRPPQAALFAPALWARGVEFWREANAREGLPRPLYLRAADVTLPKTAQR